MFYSNTRRWIRLTIAFSFTILLITLCDRQTTANGLGETPHSATVSRGLNQEVIFVPQEKGWLIPLLLPYLNLSSKELPILIALPEIPEDVIKGFLPRIKNRKILSLVDRQIVKQYAASPFKNIDFLRIPDEPGAASAFLANYFLKKAPEIILTSISDSTRLIRLSVFASNYGLPIILESRDTNNIDLRSLTQELNTAIVYLGESNMPRINLKQDIQTIELNRETLDSLIIDKIGPENIRNLIVVNPTPKEELKQKVESNPAYIVPYMSTLRNAPVLLTASKKGYQTEKEILEFIQKHQFVPKTITIVGDYGMTEVVEANSELKNRVYDGKMTLEPSSTPPDGTALAFGVGRLPFCRLSCLSLYYARLKERAKNLTKRLPVYTVMANLKCQEHEPLPLLEAISRTTADEFDNHHLKGDRYYGISSESPEILDSVKNSDIVVYEGHIEQFPFTRYSEYTANFSSPADGRPFSQYPFMVLQSCNSIEKTAGLMERGVIGIIGSCTKVHSVSGSAFVKAFFDNALYDNLTVGEALRDSKNDFLALVGLKDLIGHQNQDKTLRTGLSFRLLGDPEVKFFYQPPLPPAQKPVSARFISPKTLEVKTPARFLKTEIVDRFYLSFLPRVKPTGIIRKTTIDGTEWKQLRGFYSHRIPIDSNFDLISLNHENLSINRNQSILLVDPYQRWIYFLHYPHKQFPNQTLRFYFN